MKIAIYTRPKNAITQEEFKKFLTELFKFNFECVFHKNFQSTLKAIFNGKSTFEYFSSSLDLQDNVELMLSIGGDGTLLDVVTLLKEKSIPILGINFGRLGFLAVVGKDNFYQLFKSLIERTYFTEERMLLHVDTSAEKPQFGKIPFALNDCVIKGIDYSSMLNIKTYLNGEYLTSYWGDGIIISSPTGSTGYSLSCGGPIIFPDSNALLITPIAAHNLNNRPIVVSENSVISISVESRNSKFGCTLDARHFEFSTDVQIAIKQENFKIKLVRFMEKSFLHTIKQKLNWGFDTRNQHSLEVQ